MSTWSSLQSSDQYPRRSESFDSTSESISSMRSHQSVLVEDQLVVMLKQETSYQVTYLACTKTEVDEASAPHEEWRRKICAWSYRVVDDFRIEREVVSISMNLFDRFLNLHEKDGPSCNCPSRQRAVGRHTFQLASMTSLYVAIKVHAESCEKLRLSSMVDLSRGLFSAEDICEMERNMLSTLSWKVNPTAPSSLVMYLLRLMPPQSAIPSCCRPNYDLSLSVLNELARYLSELSVCLASVSSCFLPSEIAYASILVSMELLAFSALPECLRQEFRESVSNLMDSRNIPYLMDRLNACFWPEMLLNECGDHPIALARNLGLLDLNRFYSESGKRSSFSDRSTTSVMKVHQHHDHTSFLPEQILSTTQARSVSIWAVYMETPHYLFLLSKSRKIEHTLCHSRSL